MGLLESLQRRLHRDSKNWPPEGVEAHWDKVKEWRRRFENNHEELLMYQEEFSMSYDRARLYTPVPLAREMARLSSSLMFSASPTITHPQYQELLDSWRRINGLDPRLQEIAEHVAVEGRGAFRLCWDDDVSTEVPILSWIHEDQILWDEKHSWFVLGGTVVMERELDENSPVIYRLFEDHSIGQVEYWAFKGTTTSLGQEIALTDEAFVEVFPDYEGVQNYATGLNVPTLIRWDNVPGGQSDIQGLEQYLDRLDEAESLLLDKGRKSVPVTLADESMIDDGRSFSSAGFTFVKASGLLPEDGSPFVETIEPNFDVASHLEWIRHIKQSCIELMGYSTAMTGVDPLASYSSGKELKLRLARTLLTKAGKDRMAIEAIRTMLGTALAMISGAADIEPFKPDFTLGDGLPEDRLENAQQIQLEDSAGAISLEEKVRVIRPDWTEERVQEEVQKIKKDQREQLLMEAAQAPQPFSRPASGVQGDSSMGGGKKSKTS